MRLGHGVWTVCGGMEPSDTCDMAMVREAEVQWKATASWVAGTISLIQKSKIYFLCHVLHVTPLTMWRALQLSQPVSPSKLLHTPARSPEPRQPWLTRGGSLWPSGI